MFETPAIGLENDYPKRRLLDPAGIDHITPLVQK